MALFFNIVIFISLTASLQSKLAEGRLGKVSPHNFRQPSTDIPECSKEQLMNVEGYLLDLDGTIYNREKLLPGALEFFDWLEAVKTPFVLLSNAFKHRSGVSLKLSQAPFKLNQAIDTARVHTAGSALADYMTDNVPKAAKVYAIGTSVKYPDGSKDFLTRILQRDVPQELVSTWEMRTDLNMTEIHHWAHLARDLEEPVYVVMAVMADPHDVFGDDQVTHKSGYNTMDYNLMKKINTLLRNNAYFIVGAPDVADSQPRSKLYPKIDTAWPTCGGFEHMFMQSCEMFPGSSKERKYHVNTGKGGNQGAKYMVEKGINMLKEQSASINQKNVMIIGDNFGTDIKSGNEAGIQSMLVLVGAHQLHDQENWKSTPSCYLENVGRIPEIMGAKPKGPAKAA